MIWACHWPLNPMSKLLAPKSILPALTPPLNSRLTLPTHISSWRLKRLPTRNTFRQPSQWMASPTWWASPKFKSYAWFLTRHPFCQNILSLLPPGRTHGSPETLKWLRDGPLSLLLPVLFFIFTERWFLLWHKLCFTARPRHGWPEKARKKGRNWPPSQGEREVRAPSQLVQPPSAPRGTAVWGCLVDGHGGRGCVLGPSSGKPGPLGPQLHLAWDWVPVLGSSESSKGSSSGGQCS